MLAVIISLAALAVAAATLWQSALRPAEISFEHLDEFGGFGSGGSKGIPSGLFSVDLTFAVTNLGARAGLLKSFDLKRVDARGAPALARKGSPPWLTADGNVLPVFAAFPRTIESGEVRTWQVKTPLDGAFLVAIRTDPTPPIEPLADLVAGIEVLELEFAWTYLRRRAFGTGTTVEHSAITVAIPGERVQGVAAEFWESDGQTELAERARRR